MAHQPNQIDFLGLFRCIAARKGQKLVHQPLHIGDIPKQGRGLLILGQHRQPQLQAGQRCAQVMADARQHPGPAFQIALDPGPHVQKRRPCRAHLDCAARLVRDVLPLAERLGRHRQTADGRHLVAQEQV